MCGKQVNRKHSAKQALTFADSTPLHQYRFLLPETHLEQVDEWTAAVWQAVGAAGAAAKNTGGQKDGKAPTADTATLFRVVPKKKARAKSTA